jgi:hypothetical protein
MNKPVKQLEDRPEPFTEAQRQETKAWLRESDKRAEEDLKEKAAQKAALLRRIRTLRQKLGREANGKECTAERREEIESELEDLKGLEAQKCGTGEPRRPSARPSARGLGFEKETDRPSANEILEAATIQLGLRSKKPHLIFSKLAEHDPARWGEAAKREAKHNPKIERARDRIKYRDIKKAGGNKWPKLDRVIAENYFQSKTLKKPLRELSAVQASIELDWELGLKISPKAFERALRRLALLD